MLCIRASFGICTIRRSPGSGTGKLSRFRAVDQNRSNSATTGSIVVRLDMKKKIWRCMYVLEPLSCRLPAVFLSGDVLILPAALVARVCGDVEHGQRRPAKNLRRDKSLDLMILSKKQYIDNDQRCAPPTVLLAGSEYVW